jgi:ribosomal protein S18 acetylase RimI-like enzyme
LSLDSTFQDIWYACKVTQNNTFELVPLSRDYYEFVRQLRNHPDIKGNFIVQEHITLESHIAYMNENSKYYHVCMCDGVPIGYVGVVANDIRIAVSPQHFQLGAGTFMLQEIVKLFPNARATVKIDNEASVNLFEKLGFKKKYFLLERGSE